MSLSPPREIGAIEVACGRWRWCERGNGGGRRQRRINQVGDKRRHGDRELAPGALLAHRGVIGLRQVAQVAVERLRPLHPLFARCGRRLILLLLTVVVATRTELPFFFPRAPNAPPPRGHSLNGLPGSYRPPLGRRPGLGVGRDDLLIGSA